jgi:hypothetical protein
MVWYRVLLLTYPRAFRRAHGKDAADVFRAACVQSWNARDVRTLIWRVAKALVDVPRHGVAERLAIRRAAQVREDARRVWIASWLERLWQDMRHAATLGRRQPLFTGGAILVLAISSGLITVLFSLSYATFYRPWPVPDPGSMQRVQSRPATANSDFAGISMAEYRYLTERTRTFAHLSATSRSTTRPIESQGQSIGDAATIYVSHQYFTIRQRHE